MTTTNPDTTVDIDSLYTKVSHVIPEVEWATMREDVRAILRLKKEKNAVIMAHTYMPT